VHGLPGVHVVSEERERERGARSRQSLSTPSFTRTHPMTVSLRFHRRSYADPDFKTPEQYEKEKWAALMVALAGSAAVKAAGA